MIYKNIKRAVFLNRPNRFIANIVLDGEKKLCHVKTTGRCRELLTEGAEVFVQEADLSEGKRKTGYDLISVYKGEKLINIDSQVPNKVFAEWLPMSGLLGKIELLKPEKKLLNSRFDFYIEADGKKAIAEVKGVTLERDGAALFPDAPTERGIRHIRELIRSADMGYDAYVIFIIQMKDVRYFAPNIEAQPEFGKALRNAALKGVKLLALDCHVTEDSITAGDLVKVRL